MSPVDVKMRRFRKRRKKERVQSQFSFDSRSWWSRYCSSCQWAKLIFWFSSCWCAHAASTDSAAPATDPIRAFLLHSVDPKPYGCSCTVNAANATADTSSCILIRIKFWFSNCWSKGCYCGHACSCCWSSSSFYWCSYCCISSTCCCCLYRCICRCRYQLRDAGTILLQIRLVLALLHFNPLTLAAAPTPAPHRA